MLKSLELFGFKSFADRTLFEFSPGITCVVGPNGSGKSNVVDALKWILGDQSAKSLRGKDMSDVIFNGSSGRRASGFAEATLTFDNSQGLLPIDTSQVAIGRRLYQSGDSEYLLNGSAVRLKDIRDVFMGTGAGTAAYSIIEQGRVDQILQANPTTRRLVFEEAAGISKFKSRRIDAERRLERVAQNLLRLTDIVDEVETQLSSTRSQASKAARFREVSSELKQLWTGLAADDHRHWTSELEESHQQLESLKQQQQEIQAAIEQIEQNKLTTDEQISEFDDKLIDHERALASDRQAIATHQSTIHHQSSRLVEVEAEIKRLREQRAIANFRLAEIEAEYLETQHRVHSFAKEHETTRSATDAKESQARNLREQIAQWRGQITEQTQHFNNLDKQKTLAVERLAVLKTQAETFARNRGVLQHELQAAEQEVQKAEAQAVERKKELHFAQQTYSEMQERVQSLQLKRSDLTDQKSFAAQQLIDLKERRSADSARLSVLEELEQRQEGIAIGVQEILKRSATSHFPPWNRILGLVRDLIDVPLELAPIIDAALGERAQLLATSDLESFLDYLDRGPAPIDGRVGFIEIIKDQKDNSPALPESESIPVEFTGQSGVFGRADRLIADAERSPGVAKAVLSDTWIVESLEDARRLMRENPQAIDIRFVTLQGEVLSPDGELFVGAVPHESSIVSRKSELRQLKNGIHQHDRHIEALIERQSVLEGSISSKQNELSSAREELQSKASDVSECSALLKAQQLEVGRLKSAYQNKLDSVEDLQLRSQQVEKEVDVLNEKLKSIEDDSVSTKTTIDQLQEQIVSTEEEIQSLAAEMKTQQLEMAKHEERLTSIQEGQARIEREHRQAKRQVEELNQQYRQSQQVYRRGSFSILKAESGTATHALALEATMRETRQFFVERDQLREQRKQLTKSEEAHHKQRRSLQDAQHEIEINIQNKKHQLTGAADRIFEEFQTPLDRYVQEGASAYRIYLSERYGDDVADQHFEQVAVDGTLVEDIASANREAPSAEEVETAPEATLVPEFSEVRDELEARVDRLRRKLKGMGHVNTEALESLEDLENRYNGLNHQLMDLQEAKSALEDIIRKINVESERIFYDTFETIRGHFQELFRKLFGGGDADIILEDPEDVLECGIDIVARPPGKELRSISLLSGGEKTMTAVGLLFAMFKSKPSPYCVLDEVDAALDEANVDRYVTVVKEFVDMTQFVVITHRKRTMTAANVLYGVTMEQAGVSKRISVSFEDVNDNGEIRTAA